MEKQFNLFTTLSVKYDNYGNIENFTHMSYTVSFVEKN